MQTIDPEGGTIHDLFRRC